MFRLQFNNKGIFWGDFSFHGPLHFLREDKRVLVLVTSDTCRANNCAEAARSDSELHRAAFIFQTMHHNL